MTVTQRPSVSLHRRLAMKVAWASLGFALLTAALCFVIALDHAREKSASSANQLLDTVEKTATIAAYADNKTIGDDVINGLMRHEIIYAANLDNDRTLHLKRERSWEIPIVQEVIRSLPSPFGDGKSIGRLTVRLDPYVTLQEAAEQAFLYTLNAFALIGLTAWIVLRLVRSTLTNPLTHLSDSIAGITEGRQQRLEQKHGADDDEFAILINYINGLLASLDDKLKAEQALNTALTTAKTETERISRAKSDFLAYLSHELRHPMNVITIAAQLAQGNETPERQKEYLQGIQIAVRSMLSIVNEVLDFSKIEAGKQELESIPFRVASVLEIVRQLHSLQAESKGVSLEVVSDTRLPARLLGDPVRLGQVLTNLVSNALKFTHQGMVRIETEQSGLSGRICSVRFSVTDTGIGMTEQQLFSLFEPFGQLGQSPELRQDGTGLGLVISRQLVRMMGGDISVGSALGKGSVFSFVIQFPVASQSDAEEAWVSQTGATSAGAQIGRLLLVDDSEINRMLAAKLLSVNGFDVDTAAGGEEAVNAVLQRGMAYGAVLMDLKMPGTDGFAATQRIRKHYRMDELPIIAVTANALREEREKCLASGFNDFMTKPIDIGELSRALGRAVKAAETTSVRD